MKLIHGTDYIYTHPRAESPSCHDTSNHTSPMKESRYLVGTTTPKTQPLKGDTSLFIEVCLGPGGGGTGGGGPGATMD